MLHCTSSYPAPATDANLLTIAALAERFDSIAGLSDHTTGVGVALASVALGAALIEKHFTLRRSDGGPDAEFSLEPSELEILCKEAERSWLSLGEVNFGLSPSETENFMFRRSLYVVEDCKKGEILGPHNVRSIRPGYGLPPKALTDLQGKRAVCDIKRGTPLIWDLVEK